MLAKRANSYTCVSEAFPCLEGKEGLGFKVNRYGGLGKNMELVPCRVHYLGIGASPGEVPM